MVVYLRIGLLEAWVIFMVLLVVFVPAFSLIFSPPPHIPQECPECPQCPECPTPQCPECPDTYEKRVLGIMRLFPWGWMPWDCDNRYCLGHFTYVFYLDEIEGYKYILVFPVPASRIYYAESIDWDTMDYVYIDFKPLNETHSYAETKVIYRELDIVGWYIIEEYGNRLYLYLTIYVVSEDTTVHDILR
jgi:hypothetical protein